MKAFDISQRLLQEQIMKNVNQYVIDNYEILYEMYSTQAAADITFDEFCIRMYITNLKNETDETKNV